MMATLIGNDTVKTYLSNTLQSERLGQTYLFCGPDGIGKFQFALAFAKEILGNKEKIDRGNHPDLHVIRPEGKLALHSMETFRDLRKRAFEKPFEGEKKIFIIDAIDSTLPEGANALLKTFEEPPEDTLIFLITSRPDRVLKTIHSRCRKIFFKPLSNEEIKAFLQKQHPDLTEEAVEEAAAFAKGSLADALQFIEEDNQILFDLIETLARGRFRSYLELLAFCQTIQLDFQERRKRLEEVFTEKLIPSQYDLSAAAKGALAKQVEGMVSLRLLNRFDKVLSLILSWFRDVEAGFSAQSENVFLLRRWADKIEQACQSGRKKDLSQVMQALSDGRLAYQRSFPVATCFEDIFLKLEFI